MSTDLAALKDQLKLETTSNADDLSSVISSGDYLPYISIMGSSSKPVKQGKISQGHLALRVGKDDIVDLGQAIDMLVIDARTKAVDLRNEERPISFFDRNSEGFKRLVEFDNNFGEGMSGVLWGLEFLVLLPSIQLATSTDPTFATFFFSNPTLRRADVSKPMNALIGSLAYIKTKFIETKKFSWHGLETPMQSNNPVSLPDISVLLEAKRKFKESTVEPIIQVATQPASNRER